MVCWARRFQQTSSYHSESISGVKQRQGSHLCHHRTLILALDLNTSLCLIKYVPSSQARSEAVLLKCFNSQRESQSKAVTVRSPSQWFHSKAHMNTIAHLHTVSFLFSWLHRAEQQPQSSFSLTEDTQSWANSGWTAREENWGLKVTLYENILELKCSVRWTSSIRC